MNTDAKIFTNNCEINPTYQKDQVEFIPQMQIGVTVYLKKKKKVQKNHVTKFDIQSFIVFAFR